MERTGSGNCLLLDEMFWEIVMGSVLSVDFE